MFILVTVIAFLIYAGNHDVFHLRYGYRQSKPGTTMLLFVGLANFIIYLLTKLGLSWFEDGVIGLLLMTFAMLVYYVVEVSYMMIKLYPERPQWGSLVGKILCLMGYLVFGLAAFLITVQKAWLVLL